ncbi:MAG TPA: ABC transporter permease, partial [Methylophilaceae bacterium]|nr:ABC transporter permease [Methylophilaceae bacterium]
WIAVFAIQPISAIYYPVAVLPEWLQPVAWSLPSSYVFEGMRELLFKGNFNTTLLWQAMGLNLLYLICGIIAFLAFFRAARRQGLLLQIGE